MPLSIPIYVTQGSYLCHLHFYLSHLQCLSKLVMKKISRVRFSYKLYHDKVELYKHKVEPYKHKVELYEHEIELYNNSNELYNNRK